MHKRQGPPKHQNRVAWKPNAGRKINETEVGGRYKPLSEITGVCLRCKGQIEWKRKYGKYKPLVEPAKCQRCSKRNVRQAYHNLCSGCAKEHGICSKCCCKVDQTIGRDLSELEAEKRAIEEALRTSRERDKRTILRVMNKGKQTSLEQPLTTNGDKVGDLFPDSSLEEYAARNNRGKDEENDRNSHESEREDEENDQDKVSDEDRDENYKAEEK